MKQGHRFWIAALAIVVLALMLALLAAGGQDALAEGDIPYSVEIDVTPDIANNVIRVRPWVLVEVAILTTDEFDATGVDPDTVCFAGAPAEVAEEEDVDGDGYDDVLLYFYATEMIELDRDSTKATLTGQTGDGMLIEGTANVKVRETGKG